MGQNPAQFTLNHNRIKRLEILVLFGKWRVWSSFMVRLLGKGMFGRWSDSTMESVSGPRVCYLTMTIEKTNQTLSWAASSTWLFVLSIFLNTVFKNEKRDTGVCNCLPFQTFYQFYHTLMLKINRSNPFVSLTCLLIFISCQNGLEWEFLLCLSIDWGESIFMYSISLIFFSLNIIGSLCSFSTWVFDGREVCYRIGTEFCETGRTLGYCVFFYVPQNASPNTCTLWQSKKITRENEMYR